MQNIPRRKKSDRGSSHFRHGLDPRLDMANGWTVPLVSHILGNQCNSPEYNVPESSVVMSKNWPSWTLNDTLVPATSPVFDKMTLNLNLSK